ncbi:tyrosine-protein kinase SRK2-like [Ruditapes philippinarum]|uniref:tyrosine-protein kinase SRK2-like n=1 Tax=Ruditapes philippinarum TaxID=129788 RepID=UPI00295C3120|nr:tyrosine-protein kinase SRK2-like [Ruditapes philippinarum]
MGSEEVDIERENASGTEQQLENGSEEVDSERENEFWTEKQLEMGSEEFVTEGETDMNMTILVTTLYDFHAILDDEISFRAGDVFITFRRNLNDNNIWIKATHQGSGEMGFIPRNYVVTDFKKYYLKEWWHKFNRRDTKKQLSAPHFGPGAFIIRSAPENMSLVLSVRKAEMGANTVKTRHYKIKCTNDGKFRLSKNRLFADMTDLIKFCQNHSNNGLCCRLGKQVPKTIPDVPFRDLESPNKLVTVRQIVCPGISTGEWKNRDVTIKEYSQLENENFLTEIDILKRLKHHNIINLLAVFTKEKPFLMVFDMITIGTLHSYLRQDMGKTITHDQLLDMAIQIAKGMDYLCKEQIVHRDLRTEKILVGHGNQLKIAGLEMAKRVQNDGYVSLDPMDKIAIKWTAPEVFNEDKFTIHSDVWAFGVLLYEMITFGSIPYLGMNNQETVNKVQEGYRMKMPDDGPILCPRELYDIMLFCWDKIPTKRPTFFRIIILLHNNASPDTKQHPVKDKHSKTETKAKGGTNKKTTTEKNTKKKCVCM